MTVTLGQRYRPSVDLLIVLYAALDATRRGFIVARVALGFAPRVANAHARGRHAVYWPELVLHYVVALVTWTRDEDGNDRSAVSRFARSFAATVAFAALTGITYLGGA